VSTLPTGTVTLLLADVEGSTRLWEGEPETMAEAVARLDKVVNEVVATHGGVRPVEQGEGDSFVVAFTRASEAVSAALDLQLGGLAPIRLRIGIHTGEVQLRDEGNYIGPAINRTARIRDLGHGGQTVLSQATHDLVVDRLPEKASLSDLGTHRLKDLTRPERVHQLCHPELRTEFPPLRSLDVYPHNLPVELTSFIGRERELEQVRSLLRENRLVTLTGSGGAGKTRLALQVAAEVLGDFTDGAWHVDLAPITDAELLPIAVARALGLADDPTRSTVETIVRRVGDNAVLVILDNCEHLIAASAAFTEALLRSCPQATVMATSREPLGIGGESAWRVPSLTLPDQTTAHGESEAVRLFGERARQGRPDFAVMEGNAPAVEEICRRLDGIPLAIELAAARVRAFSPERIAAGLNDRFRLLTGGSRTAVPRQQTLRASVDWSYQLLTEPERTLFQRLSVFAGSFDLDAAIAVGAGDGLEDQQALDQLALLVDKSLVVADDAGQDTRYRLLETVRQFASEQLATSGDAEAVRSRHCNHYVAGSVAFLGASGGPDYQEWVERMAAELDNVRGAFEWSLDHGDTTTALFLAAMLTPFWVLTNRVLESRAWFDPALVVDDGVDRVARAWALACSAMLEGGWAWGPQAVPRAEEALEIAREVGDPALLFRALRGVGNAVYMTDHVAGLAVNYEALGIARELNSSIDIAESLLILGTTGVNCGDPAMARPYLEEAVAIASDGGHLALLSQAYLTLGEAMLMQGDLVDARQAFARVEDPGWKACAPAIDAETLVFLGRCDDARAGAEPAVAFARASGFPIMVGIGLGALGLADLADGDADAACPTLREAYEALAPGPVVQQWVAGPLAEAEVAVGNRDAARHLAEQTIEQAAALDCPRNGAVALLARARVEWREHDAELAGRTVHEALALFDRIGDKCGIADSLEFLALLAVDARSHEQAARLLGAAEVIRQVIGYVRFQIHADWYELAVSTARAALGQEGFDKAWAEGAALSIADAVTYAQRGRGERKRPSSGWGSLTPTEQDVVRLVGEGLANKEIAERLFISPRTVQAHLTHVYAKVGVSSRVQLAQEAKSRC